VLISDAELDTGRVHPRVGSGRVGSGRGSHVRRYRRVGSGHGSDLILPKFFVDYFSLFVFLLLSLDEGNNIDLWVAQYQITGHGSAARTVAVFLHSGRVQQLPHPTHVMLLIRPTCWQVGKSACGHESQSGSSK